MIGILDYGLGNIEAFRIAYKRLNIESRPVSTPKDYKDVTHLILPGVGAFDQAMEKFRASGLELGLRQAASNQIPILGVCVGMQMLADQSEEGVHKGLGLVPGKVRHFGTRLQGNKALRCPHMGWNGMNVTKETKLLDQLDEAEFYFLHSYWFDCEQSEHTLAKTNYGGHFSCVVAQGTVFGTQFHPEKSHDAGLKLLSNFKEL